MVLVAHVLDFVPSILRPSFRSDETSVEGRAAALALTEIAAAAHVVFLITDKIARAHTLDTHDDGVSFGC
ncbi:MAG: hypothetical protein H5U24_06085 [Thioclava marina]|nr:hypothetical protein [Thioclava marina]